MKYLSILLVIMLASCHPHTRHSQADEKQVTPSAGHFGETITPDQSLSEMEYSALFNNSDTAECKITGTITASCKHSGCWMDVTLGDGEIIHTTFLDESFTIPLDAAGKKVVAEGTMFRKTVPVETLQNYAREDGKSEEEIAAITEPSYVYRFIAKGVILK